MSFITVQPTKEINKSKQDQDNKMQKGWVKYLQEYRKVKAAFLFFPFAGK